MNNFLVQFQTDEPMVPFLCQCLEDILRSLASRVILKDVLNNANTCIKLVKVNFKDPSQHKRPENVDVGVAAKIGIHELKMKGRVTETQIIRFKRDVISLLSTICSHIAEKSPLKMVLARRAICLIPSMLVESPDKTETRFASMVEILVRRKQITASCAEDAKKELSGFIRVVVCENRDSFLQFDKPSDSNRLDDFYWQYLNLKKYQNLAEVVKIILTLSHGQASVERGFSVNKTLLVENLSEVGLVSQRVIHDHMNANALLPHTINITPSLRRYVKSARQRYQNHLADQAKSLVSNEKQLKRKAINEQIDQIKKKKTFLISTTNELHTDTDHYISQAESCNTLDEVRSLLAKSSSFRRTAKEKELQVSECSNELKKLVKSREDIV